MENTKQLSASQLIKKDLKQAYPSTKFSVSGDHNLVKISWENGVNPCEVADLLAKYKYGKFNSSDDCYEITNSRKDIPQVKYVYYKREMSEDVLEMHFAKLKRFHYEFMKLTSIDEYSEELFKRWGVRCAREYILRALNGRKISNQKKV